MSRRTFWQEHYEVVAGWDRGLQHYFLDIYDHTAPLADDADERFSYTSLDEPEGVYESYDLQKVRDTLRGFRIIPPETFYADLAEDAEVNRGNLEVNYLRGGA